LTYEVAINRRADKQLRGITPKMIRRIRKRIVDMSEDPYGGAQKMEIGAGFRVRVGDYRILFDVDDAARQVNVTAIRHRREAYR
jgi:mRNA interferase RelE/StbE